MHFNECSCFIEIIFEKCVNRDSYESADLFDSSNRSLDLQFGAHNEQSINCSQ